LADNLYTGLPHPGKVLDFFAVLESSLGSLNFVFSPGKYLEGFSCFTGTE